MFILNTGGTLNKRYNPLNGELEVPFDNLAIEEIFSSFSYDITVAGAIYKDSLEMNLDDRKMISSIIANNDEKDVLLIHGTDTMDLTATFLDTIFDDKVIVITGSMVPYSIDKTEATCNLAMAYGFLNSHNEAGVYICMSGYIVRYDQIVKNRDLGRFELAKKM